MMLLFNCYIDSVIRSIMKCTKRQKKNTCWINIKEYVTIVEQVTNHIEKQKERLRDNSLPFLHFFGLELSAVE